MAHIQIQAVEEGYTAFINGLYEQALDLNVPMSQVANQCMQLMDKREELLNLYGVVTAKIPAAPAASAAVATNIAGQYRMKLLEVASKKAAKQCAKEDFVFETNAVDRLWVTTLTSPLLSTTYQGETPLASKKASENAAAEAALKAEYPEEHARIAAPWSVPALPRAPKRRAAEAVDPMLSGDNKGKLSHVMSLLLGRTVTKADLVYTMDAATSVATLSIPNFQGGNTYQGEKAAESSAAATQKAAESSAAGVALAAMDGAIGPALEEHKAKKARKMAEIQAQRAERRSAEGGKGGKGGKGAAATALAS